MADTSAFPNVTETPKKRKINGRKRDNDKKARLSSHKCGESCRCKRLQCFNNVKESERETLLHRFNGLKTKDEQDAMIASHVTVQRIKQRRPRKDEDNAALHKYAYQYHVLCVRETLTKVRICFMALLSIFGIGKSRLERIQKSLTSTGGPPSDKRGQHLNRPHAFNEGKIASIINHIKSFRGRQSHYSLKESKKFYLPAELSVSRMHQLYMDAHPGEKCCRESYRKIFEEQFNISFGYPRKDTCSTCDTFKVEMAKESRAEDLRKLTMERELHWRKGETFYTRKATAATDAKSTVTKAAVAFDFWKNLQSPNITTNDTYYRRQLSLFTFNIHNLATDEVFLYTYDETVGKKGANEVTSMLLHFVANHLSPQVTNLKLFCDSCAGQNKNWTMFRFLHYLVHKKKRFEEIKITFPIRGHSYMECDRDMVPVNQKLEIETPAGWMDHFRQARQNPSPFNVVPVTQEMLLNVDTHISTLYFSVCPIKSQPLREVIFSIQHPRLMMYRECWNGNFSSAVVSKPVGKRRINQAAFVPTNTALLPIPAPKFKDLMVLKRFCTQSAADFFCHLPHQGQRRDEDHSDTEWSVIDDEEEPES